MKRGVLDTEANGLLRDVTRAHIIGFKDKDTGKRYTWLEDQLGWQDAVNDYDVMIGHHVMGYDFPMMYKLFGFKPKPELRIQDTLVMSQVLNYNRFPSRRHSMEEWGQFLGFPKIEFNDFAEYSEEMLVYWHRDLDLNDKIHDVVYAEYVALFQKTKNISAYLQSENAVAKWNAIAELEGWPFDVENAKKLLEVFAAEMEATKAKIVPRLGTKTVAIDKANGIVEPKKPKWLKSGDYDKHTASWFGIDQDWGRDEDPYIEGPYSRVEFKDLDLDSVADVKIFLFRNGWVPTEYNTKPNPDGRGKIQTSPKITEDSLECMDGDGKLYCDFLTTKSRHSILKGWLEAVDPNGRLHGECFSIGTPSMRSRHSIIVNVPAAESQWGKEMRALFTTRPGWKLVGCDSAGNQARGLAHYLGSKEFIDILLHGDIHTFNANALDGVLKEMGIDWSTYLTRQGVTADKPHTAEEIAEHERTGEELRKVHTQAENIAKRKRAAAKRILYAFLFGASGGKLWSYIFGVTDDKNGKRLKLGFTKAVPGFKALLEKLENIYGKTKQYGDGYIPGIAGNRIYCDSFHKLLVYLLQACEKATCSAACMLLQRYLEAAKIPYQPCIMMHDELDFMVPEEYAEEAARLGKQAFIDGPKLFGIDIMDGGAKIGHNWYDVH